MNRILSIVLLCFFTIQGFSQQGQLSIPRIDEMPNVPQPFEIRDWHAVALAYDSFVFSLNKTGEYLPLIRLGTVGQFNYPDNIPLFLDTYVGANDHSNQAEAINILPAIVGAGLVGIDKSNQDGTNWAAKAKDFFNLKNGQDVYLNNYATKSGNDWWYDIMPNVYFYQLHSLYPNAAPEFSAQFTTVANRWLYCVNQLGGSTRPWKLPNMNYRAFDLATGTPLKTGVPEPESAGSIAWLLYNAYSETGNRKYYEGAQLALDFLAGFASNPSYELQLPYGTLVAARMNAMEGTNYPIQKMLDWCFNRGDLRGWGSIKGTWGGYDVSGLIGEANDAGNDYAFVMNGFQQVAALAPLSKYDKRYARAIAKWILNVTNASRLFYHNAMPQSNQDAYAWASARDPSACIPYESMKEVRQGKTPFATGDAVAGGWAATNLSLYSGSGVGYLASVIQKTNIPEILQINLNKTDFYGDTALISYLYFNPTTSAQTVGVSLPQGIFNVYDAITETNLFTAVTGSVQLSIPAGEVRLIRLYASDLQPVEHDNRLYAGNAVLDYHYKYTYTAKPYIKALSADSTVVVVNTEFTAYCMPGNVNEGEQVSFEWFLNDALIADQNQPQIKLSIPTIQTQAVLKCKITANSISAEDTLHLRVVEYLVVPPVVNGIQSSAKYTVAGAFTTFTALTESVQDETLEYAWSASAGILSQSSGNPVSWNAPETPSVAILTVKVTNKYKLSATLSTNVLVKDTSLSHQTPLIWYPFDSDTRNASEDNFHATASGVSKTEDARGMPSIAYRFTSGQNIIFTENHARLNFTDAVSISCWVKCEQLGSERFIISHGSWQQRYKLSVTTDGLLRWTVRTSTGVTDLDGSAPLELNRYYHVTALYTGYSLELYVDGVPDTFKALSGAIQSSTKPFTIGRMDDTETLYAWRGSIDEVKLWDKEIPVSQIEQLKNQWAITTAVEEEFRTARVYPNPADDIIFVDFSNDVRVKSVSLYTMEGKKVSGCLINNHADGVSIEIPPALKGFYLLKIVTAEGWEVIRKVIVR